MEINGIDYEINTNIKLGVQRRMKEDPENFEYTIDFIRNVLIPMPSIEEVEDMGNDDVGDIMVEYEKVQKKKNVDFKKKRSL